MTHRKKSITERKNPVILINCITNSTQHVNYSTYTRLMHKCPGVNDRKKSTTDRKKIRRYTGSLQVSPYVTQTTVGIHKMAHRKKSITERKKSIHPQQLYN